MILNFFNKDIVTPCIVITKVTYSFLDQSLTATSISNKVFVLEKLRLIIDFIQW